MAPSTPTIRTVLVALAGVTAVLSWLAAGVPSLPPSQAASAAAKVVPDAAVSARRADRFQAMSVSSVVACGAQLFGLRAVSCDRSIGTGAILK